MAQKNNPMTGGPKAAPMNPNQFNKGQGTQRPVTGGKGGNGPMTPMTNGGRIIGGNGK